MGTKLADMQLISKCNKTVQFVLCVIDIMYVDIIANMHGLFLWKVKKALQLLMVFKKYQRIKPHAKHGSVYIDHSVESNDKSLKFRVDNHVYIKI